MDIAEQPILEINDLKMDYEQTSALESITMKIYKNKITALVGSSGSGKSSFLTCLNQLFQSIPCCKVEGEIYYAGSEILRNKTNLINLRREIGMVFQAPNPFPMSIHKNVSLALKELGIYSKTEINERVVKALQKVGLWSEVKDRLNRSAMELSGGQQQRLCIARAIALEPQVLLLDEPTSSLDPVSTKKIEELMQSLKSEMTLVLVTHSLSQARRVADKIGFFAVENGKGCLIEYGDVQKIFSAPEKSLTQDFISSELL